MRQILAEAFNVSNDYLREVDERYAALALLPSASFDEPQPTTIAIKNLKTDVEKKVPLAIGVSVAEKEVEEAEMEPPLVFDKGDMVEIFHSEQWYAGVDKSQRFGQRTPRHLLREPQEVPAPPALYKYAAEAWRTAASWAFEPFR
ncbi:unnamed protein product [Peronospora farinosa]|nr:unnamed protein product [Peronospora farinosa]